MPEFLHTAEIPVPKDSEARARALIDKILELCVRTDHIRPNVLRAGSYVHRSSAARSDDVEFRGYSPEIAVLIGDAHADADESFEDPEEFKQSTPRFYLEAEALSGQYDKASAPREEHKQQTIERITLHGGPIEGLLESEVEGEVRGDHPLVLEYRFGEGDGELDLSDLSPEELTETVNALLLSFWVRYQLVLLKPGGEIWADLHMTEEEIEAEKWQPGGVDDPELEEWLDSLEDREPPEVEPWRPEFRD